MSFDVNEIMNKVGGNDLVKTLSEKAGVGTDQAQQIAQDLLSKAQSTGGGLLDNVKGVAEKFGLPHDQVENIAQNLGATLQEKSGDLGEMATGALSGVMSKLNGTPIGDALKVFDKDGDGNPINDLAKGAEDLLGGLFGKK